MMKKTRMSFRLVSMVTAAMFVASSCGGPRAGGQEQPLPDAGHREGGAFPDLESEVAALRNLGPTVIGSAEFGTIPGGASVDGQGNARYSMSVDVAPGPNGQQPSLSIAYSSSGRNSKLGLGFSLGGIPTMARCRHSIADDGYVGEIEFDDDDALCFNGQRLVVVSGGYGQPGSEYRTIRSPQSKIVLEEGSISDRYSKWVVYQPDGEVLRFGETESGVATDEGLEPFAWLLQSAEDRFGNAVEYSWYTIHSPASGTPDYWLEEINYGPASIEFEYEIRTNDEMHGYYAGVPYARERRLKDIIVNGLDGSRLHTYTLDYQAHAQTRQSTLTSVQKCDANGACLPATTFEWSSVDAGLGYSACDEISADAFGSEEFDELTPDDLRVLAPANSVVLDAFGDLEHEFLLWGDGESTSLPHLWGRSIPGAPGIDMRQTQAYSTSGVIPGTPIEGPANEDDPWTYGPSFAPSAVRILGKPASDVLVPVRLPEAGQDPVGPSQDFWGASHASGFQVLSGFHYNSTVDGVGFVNNELSDGANGKIYSAVPLDHDADGMTDLWLCRGDGFKSGEWVLGRNKGAEVPPFDFEWTETGIQCSIHDELLAVPLHGDGRTSLLVVPAYDSDVSVASFAGNYDEYLTSPAIQPISDADRDQYYEVTLDQGLAVTGLPRGYFQSWHDRNCRNGVADAEMGTPVYTAGMGGDRLVDINGDGYTDILRAELASGDGHDNIVAIKHGLDATAFGDESFLCSPTDEQDLVIRAYINTGRGFERRSSPEITFAGLAHVNYWVNWRKAVPYDHNADGLTDFLLPGAGVDEFGGATWLYSDADGDYFVGGNPSLPGHFVGYDGGTADDEWEELFQTTSRGIPVDDGHHIWFVGLHGPDALANPLCPLGTVAQQAHVQGAHGHVTLDAITNGLGARQEFTYELGPRESIADVRPAGRLRKQSTVVRELAVQAGPGPDGSDPPMHRTEYSYGRPYYDDHGRSLVGHEWVQERRMGVPQGLATEPYATTTRYFDFSYNPTIADYPYVGRPQLVETVSYNETDYGGLQRVVSCEDVADDPSRGDDDDGWVLIRPYQGQTWFSYPAFVRSYTLVVPDPDKTSEIGCGDAILDDGVVNGGSVSALQYATTRQTLNGWGRMASREFETEGDVTRTEFSEWVINENEWFIHPQRTEIESCVDGTCETRTTRRVFDPATHALQHAYREPDAQDNTYLHTSFQYNSFGNLTETKVEGIGSYEPRVTTSTWDPNGVVSLSATNAKGHTAYVVTDPASGVSFANVDPNGVTTRLIFDGFRRPVAQGRYPSPMALAGDGAQTTTNYGPGDATLGAAFEIQESLLGQSTRTQIGPTGKVLQVTFRGVTPSQTFPVPEQAPPGGDIYYRNEYDALGRLARTSHNTFVGNDPDYWTEYEYDESSRRRRAVVVDSGGSELSDTEQRWASRLGSDYGEPLHRFFTDEEGHQRSEVSDHKGRVVIAFDAAGTGTCFDYGPFGRLDTVRRNCYGVASDPNPPQPSTSYTYDVLGRVLTETDPAFGTRITTYTPFDQPETTEDAKGQIVSFQYDSLGRKEQEVAPEGVSLWTYDASRTGYLSSSFGPDGIQREFAYDEYSRVARETTHVSAFGNASGDKVEVDYEYDIGNRVSSIEFEKDLGLSFRYDNTGYHRSTHFVSPDGEELVWGWEHADANNAVLQETFGADSDPTKRTRTQRQYDAVTGRLEWATTDTQGSILQAYSFGWTPAGDLDYRLDSLHLQAEDFEYDALHRLTSSEVDGVTRSYQYDALGNFTYKDGVGTYHYGADGTRLLYTTNSSTSTTYDHDANGAVEKFGATNIMWTSFGKMRSIWSPSGEVQVRYDADGTRVLREDKDGFIVKAHPLYERRFDTDGKLGDIRIKATSATGAVVGEFRFKPSKKSGQSKPLQTKTATWSRSATRYIHDDHLGSAGLITDEVAKVVDRVAFDPWGRARDAQDWNVYLSDSATDDLPIGFTGHQAELDGGLINMRGRMYDPRLGRFMSVDPVIAGVTDTVAWNSYAYVKNRPLSLVDPTGLSPEGEGDSDSGWSENREWSDDLGMWCDGISGDGACIRNVAISSSETPLAAGGGPIGAGYWGMSDGSGIGMRGQNAIDQMLEMQRYMARQALEEELKFWRSVGQCSTRGNVTTCGLRPLRGEKSIQEGMAGAFALLKGLNLAGEGVAAVTPLGDGVDIVDAWFSGDEAALAMAVGFALIGLIPGGKGAKIAANAADAADAVHDASKVLDGAKAAKGGEGSVVFHRYKDAVMGNHVTAEIRGAGGKSLGEFHQTGIARTRIEAASDFAGKKPVGSTKPRALSDPEGAAEFGGSGFDAGKYRRGTNDCVTGACAIGNAGSPTGGTISPSAVRRELGI